MEQQGTYVGVDVSKARLDVALRPGGELFSEANDQRAISRLVKRLKPLGCERIVVEATGGYETLLVGALYAAGLPVVVVNPRWVRNFARSIGQLAKTDAIDARVLAMYAERPELTVRELPDEQTRELKALCTRRDELVEMIGAEQNRLEHAPQRLHRELRGHIDYLRKRLKKLDQDLDQMVRRSDLWRAKSELLESAPGIGGVGRAVLLARLPELGRLNRAEVGKLVGVAPFNRDSGKYRGLRRTGDGRFVLRRTLYMCTLTAVRCDPMMRAYYQGLRERGKPFKVALIACLRKFLIILNAMLKTGTPWRSSCPANL
jgi:transposase